MIGLNSPLNYTELNVICHIVGDYKMPIYRAKHEYIQYYLYMLSLPSCNGNTPVTLSPTRLPCSLKFEIKVHKNVLLAPPPPDSRVCELPVRRERKILVAIQILSLIE